MADHYEEEAQVEQLKRWWKENWKSLASGLALGLLVIFGWEALQRYKTHQAEMASQLFEDLKVAQTAKQSDQVSALAEKLIREFAKTPYATGAALYLAQDAAAQNKLDDAQKHLQWVLDHGSEAGMRDLAQLRLARVLWQKQQLDEALKLLEGEHPGFDALYAELKGDIKLAQNDRAAARASYEQALAKSEGPNRELLQRKLDDLTDLVKS